MAWGLYHLGITYVTAGMALMVPLPGTPSSLMDTSIGCMTLNSFIQSTEAIDFFKKEFYFLNQKKNAFKNYWALDFPCHLWN